MPNKKPLSKCITLPKGQLTKKKTPSLTSSQSKRHSNDKLPSSNFSFRFMPKVPRHSQDIECDLFTSCDQSNAREIGNFKHDHHKQRKIQEIGVATKSGGYERQIMNRWQLHATMESEGTKLQTEEDKLGDRHTYQDRKPSKIWYKNLWWELKKQAKKVAYSNADADRSSDESISESDEKKKIFHQSQLKSESDEKKKIFHQFQMKSIKTDATKKPSDSTRIKFEKYFESDEYSILPGSEGVMIVSSYKVLYSKIVPATHFLSHRSSPKLDSLANLNVLLADYTSTSETTGELRNAAVEDRTFDSFGTRRPSDSTGNNLAKHLVSNENFAFRSSKGVEVNIESQKRDTYKKDLAVQTGMILESDCVDTYSLTLPVSSNASIPNQNRGNEESEVTCVQLELQEKDKVDQKEKESKATSLMPERILSILSNYWAKEISKNASDKLFHGDGEHVRFKRIKNRSNHVRIFDPDHNTKYNPTEDKGMSEFLNAQKVYKDFAAEDEKMKERNQDRNNEEVHDTHAHQKENKDEEEEVEEKLQENGADQVTSEKLEMHNKMDHIPDENMNTQERCITQANENQDVAENHQENGEHPMSSSLDMHITQEQTQDEINVLPEEVRRNFISRSISKQSEGREATTLRPEQTFSLLSNDWICVLPEEVRRNFISRSISKQSEDNIAHLKLLIDVITKSEKTGDKPVETRNNEERCITQGNENGDVAENHQENEEHLVTSQNLDTLTTQDQIEDENRNNEERCNTLGSEKESEDEEEEEVAENHQENEEHLVTSQNSAIITTQHQIQKETRNNEKGCITQGNKNGDVAENHQENEEHLVTSQNLDMLTTQDQIEDENRNNEEWCITLGSEKESEDKEEEEVAENHHENEENLGTSQNSDTCPTQDQIQEAVKEEIRLTVKQILSDARGHKSNEASEDSANQSIHDANICSTFNSQEDSSTGMPDSMVNENISKVQAEQIPSSEANTDASSDESMSTVESTRIKLYRNVTRNETSRMMSNIDTVMSEAVRLFGFERSRIFFDLLLDEELCQFESAGTISEFVPNMVESTVRQNVKSFFENASDMMNILMTLLLSCPDSNGLQQMAEQDFISVLKPIIQSLLKTKTKGREKLSLEEKKFTMVDPKEFEKPLGVEIPEDVLIRLKSGDEMVVHRFVDTRQERHQPSDRKENRPYHSIYFPSDCRLFIYIPKENVSYWHQLDMRRANKTSQNTTPSRAVNNITESTAVDDILID